MFGGPVTILKVKAAICPCLLIPKESSASQAISAIGGLPIKYHVPSSSDENGDSSSNGGVGKFVSNLFKGAANAAVAASGSASGCYKKGKIYIVDSYGGPTLFIETEKDGDGAGVGVGAGAGVGGVESGSNDKIKEDQNDMRIKLKKIGEVSAYDSFLSSGNAGIAIYKKSNKTRGSSNTEQHKAELIRFDILSSDVFNDDENSVTSEERDDVIENLRIVIEWDVLRRKNNPTEDQEDEDDGESNSKSIALKAKYFVQREIEMKKQKKDREDRKARYLKDSGGLKYTALAMANREIS